jgi:hypothetical protein
MPKDAHNKAAEGEGHGGVVRLILILASRQGTSQYGRNGRRARLQRSWKDRRPGESRHSSASPI